MTPTAAASTMPMETWALDLLYHQPEPLAVYLPVWSEAGHPQSLIDFEVAYANKEATRQLQLESGQLLSQQAFAAPHKGSTGTTQWFALLRQALHSGDTLLQELYYADNGQDRWFRMSLSRLPEQGVAVRFTNITETKTQRATIQWHDNRINTIFETSHAGLYTLKPVRDEAGTIIDFRFGLVNQAVASYLGLQAADLAGSLGSTYFPAYKTNGLFDQYIQVMKTGEATNFELHYADGYDNFFNINVVKIGDEILCTFTDQSPLKRAQRELEASVAELKRSNASLEQFAHAASHDLQEPLRKIAVNADKLQEQHGEELSDAAFGYVERIQTASKRMRRLIQDLLVFAEVGANRNSYEEVNLNRLLQDVVADLEVAIAERDAVVVVEDLGTIQGDSLHLQQLFQNLISNALKYSKPQVPPRIAVRATQVTGRASGFTLPDHELDKPYWLVQVQDNGQGFTPEQTTQIFKIFQRLPQHRHEYSGTGIGLAIVQRVVENHSGYIRAEGVPGEGATFSILLPA